MTAFSQKTKASPSNPASYDNGKEAFFGIQRKLNIGKSNDKYEIEADKVADSVVSRKQSAATEPFFSAAPLAQKKASLQIQKPEEKDTQKVQSKKQNTKNSDAKLAITPVIQAKAEEDIRQKKEDEAFSKDEEVQKLQMSASGDANPADNSKLENSINNSKGSGSSLPKSTRSEMESGIGADFSNVKIHHDSNAAKMNRQLGSQAFATGNNIYFNEGKYNPDSQSGKHLLAHELTHTVQQGAALRMKPGVSDSPQMIQAFGFVDLIPDWIKNDARHIPGYTLFTVIASYDPLNGRDVARTPVNLLEGLMGLVPFGTAIFDKLQEYGIIQQVFDWVEGKLGELGLTTQGLLDMLEEAWNELEFPYTDAIDIITAKFNRLINRITTFAGSLVDQIITWIKEALVGVAEPLLAENKAWDLIKKIIRYDPLRDQEVTATTVEILEDFLILIGKQTELEQMREKGTLQETADWLDTQVGTFMSLLGELRGLITMAWNAIQPQNLTNIAENLNILADQAGGFLQRVWDFASGVALKVLELVKKSLLGWLSSEAGNIRGFSLVKVIIGKDPFTDVAVPRTVPNLIRGFMSLMDGGEAQYAQMEESGAIARIVGEIEAAVETLNMTPEYIIQLFTDIWNSLTIDDLIHPIDAFLRIIDTFGEPIGRLIAFVAEIVRIVIVAILEIMNFPFDLIGNIISRALGAIEDIKKDPIGFLKNILRAIKQGFVQFFDNIITHLIGGVTGWLMSELKDANLPVLIDFSLQGVISWVLEVLGISMERIWEKLAAHPRIGPQRVARIRGMINTLEGIWTFIKDVQERGIAAIWDKIQEQLSNLWNTVLDAVKNFVMERVVNQITARLLSMLDPTGIMAVINGAMAFFNAIQSFIKYLREMLEIVNSFVNGVADIAQGNVTTAANYLERTMGQAMPVVIGFLANQVGLAGIGRRVGEMIISVRELIDQALTWLVNKAVDTGMGILDRVMGTAAPGATPEVSSLPPLTVDEDFEIGTDDHELKTTAGTDQLEMHSRPIQLSQHPSDEVKTAYATYLTEIAAATSATSKREAANRNLRIIIQKIKAFGDPDAPGASAPGIGTVDLHANQQSRMRRSGIPVWFTESEHVIPRAFVNAAFEALAQAGVPAGAADYRNMNTILIYKEAADIKTDGPFGDQSTINDFKNTIVEILHEVYGTHQKDAAAARSEMAATVVRLLSAFASDAKSRTNLAITQENQRNGAARGPAGTPEPPTPTQSGVTRAFNAQKADVNNQLQSRINQFVAERD